MAKIKLKLYNYENKLLIFEIQDNIKEIDVEIVTGDEIATVYYEDGTSEKFDSGELEKRVLIFGDEFYTVTKEKIKQWNDFSVSNGQIISYARADFIDQLKEKDVNNERTGKNLNSKLDI